MQQPEVVQFTARGELPQAEQMESKLENVERAMKIPKIGRNNLQNLVIPVENRISKARDQLCGVARHV